MAEYKAFAFFTEDGEGLESLTVTCDVYTATGVLVANNQSATEIAGGFYSYVYSGDNADYLFVFKTASELVDQKQIPVLYGDRTLLPEDILNLEDGIEENYSMKQILRAVSSILLGKLSGANTANISFKDINDSKTRISATVDGIGNRTGVTIDVS